MSYYGASVSAKNFVDSLVSTYKVVIFGKTSCPYTRLASNIFARLDLVDGALYEADISERPDMAEIQTYLGELTGATTVPRVFVDGKCIGGGQDVSDKFETGELQAILRQCHAFKRGAVSGKRRANV